MRLQAFAKINLGLDVLGKREDGYHEVRMIMQTIRMYDQLDMRKSVEPGIHLTTNKKYIPVDEKGVNICITQEPPIIHAKIPVRSENKGIQENDKTI